MLAARKYQKGASIWLILLMVIVLGFAAVFGLKLIPIYIESFKIDKAMEGALAEDSANRTAKEIKDALIRRLDIDDVRRIQDRNYRDYVTITKKGNRVTLEVAYDAVERLFGNLYVVAKFEKSFSN